MLFHATSTRDRTKTYRMKRQRRYLKIKPGAAPQEFNCAIQTSAESAIQLALIQLVYRK